MTTFRSARAALAAAALLTACSAATESLTPGPERATTTLNDTEIRTMARILGFEDQRHYDPVAFDALAEGGVEIRRRAAMAAGRIGDTAAVTLLVRMLDDDPSPAVRADAAFALGELGDTSSVVLESLRQAVPEGWVPVRSEETAVVVEVIQALGKLGTFDARAMVVDALRFAYPADAPRAKRVVAEALLSIWRFREGPGRVNAVVRYLDSEDPEIRWRAAYALMRLRVPDAAPRLLPLLHDSDHRARANAARALSSALADSAGVRKTALAALTTALSDRHPHVRINVVRVLAGYGDDAPVDSMARLLDDDDPQVAVAAAEALAEFAAPAAAPLTAILADAERPYALRAAAARDLAEEAPDTVLSQLTTWADGDFTARYAAARTVSALGLDRAAPLLRRLVADPDRRVSVAALGSAGQLAADTAAPAAARDGLRRMLEPIAGGEDYRRALVATRAVAPLVDSTELTRLRAAHDTVVVPEGGEAADRTTDFYENIVRTYIVPALARGKRPHAVIETAGGRIELELLAAEAPLTVHNFVTLARSGFWDQGVWHRVVPNFVLQDGAPAGDPSGGPGWSIRDEINRVRYTRGVLGMALSGPDTGGSQWFITHSPQHHLDGGYTVFGRVVDGMDVADRVLQGDPIETIRIVP